MSNELNHTITLLAPYFDVFLPLISDPPTLHEDAIAEYISHTDDHNGSIRFTIQVRTSLDLVAINKCLETYAKDKSTTLMVVAGTQ